MDKLLLLLEKNPRLTNEELAVILGVSEREVKEEIDLYEQAGIIKGYRTIIDKDKAQAHTVTALIEIKVKPRFGHGFDDVARRISQLDEVESIYLMSGGFDLCCLVSDKSFEEIAMFVVKRLSPLEDVISTTTHFILKRYKDQGIDFGVNTDDDRRNVSF